MAIAHIIYLRGLLALYFQTFSFIFRAALKVNKRNFEPVELGYLYVGLL